MYSSVADPERFHDDADLTHFFMLMRIRIQFFLARVREKISSKSIFSKILQNLSCVIFSVTMIKLTKKNRH